MNSSMKEAVPRDLRQRGPIRHQITDDAVYGSRVGATTRPRLHDVLLNLWSRTGPI